MKNGRFLDDKRKKESDLESADHEECVRQYNK